jgi:hypothetical protein
MSAISGAGVWLHKGSHWQHSRAGSISGSSSLTTSSINGSVTGSVGVIPTGNAVRLKQIEQAVTKALQTSGPTANANAVVQRAIESAIRNPTVDSDGNASAGDDGSHQLFVQTLSAYGVTPEQFHSDLLDAIRNVQGGSAGPSGNVSSFPAGLVLDTSA